MPNDHYNYSFEPKQEQRQHLSLSQYASDTVENDSITFTGDKNVSGFINRIVLNYNMYVLDDTADNQQWFDTNAGYSKDVTRKIRLNNTLYNILDELTELYDISSPATFIKAIIENYSRKTLFEREEIYYADDLIKVIKENLNSPKGSKRLLKVTTKKHEVFLVDALRISDSYESPFHYLIGYSKRDGEDEFKASSFKLSNIADITVAPKSKGMSKVIGRKDNGLEDIIKTNGVPYVLGDSREFIIRLTNRGKAMYDSIFHLRPKYTDITRNPDGSFTLTFHCTERQIMNYFTNFCDEALILSPESTRQAMEEKYRRGYESYKDITL